MAFVSQIVSVSVSESVSSFLNPLLARPGLPNLHFPSASPATTC